MGDNQNYGDQQYSQDPYGNQQSFNNQQPYGDQQYNHNPYGNQQYNQQPYGDQQYNQGAYGNQPYNQQPYAQPLKPVVYDALPNNHSGVAVASLICGVLGIVFFWFPFVDLGVNIAGLICAIVALSKKYDGKGMAIGGLVTSIIGLLISLFYMVCFFISMAVIL